MVAYSIRLGITKEGQRTMTAVISFHALHDANVSVVVDGNVLVVLELESESYYDLI